MCNYIAPAFDQFQNQNTIRSQSKGAANKLHFIIHGNKHSHSWPSLSVCICRTSTTDSASTQFPIWRRFIFSASFSFFRFHGHVYCSSSSLGARRYAEVYRQGRCLAFDPTQWRGRRLTRLRCISVVIRRCTEYMLGSCLRASKSVIHS